jgi:hypothetical protein
MKAVLRELVAVFVDDGAFAVAIVTWLGLMGLILPRLGLTSLWNGIILFAGLATILLESAIRRSRRR